MILFYSVLAIILICIAEDKYCDSSDNVIKSINLDKFLSGNESTQQLIGDQFDEAMRDHGFLYLTNHGVPDNIIKSFYNATNEFFDQSDKYKLEYHTGIFGSSGYMPYGLQNNKIEIEDEFDGYDLSDLVESYCTYNKGHDWYLMDPKWSDIPSEFLRNNVMQTYLMQMDVLLSRLHYLASYSLGLETNQFQMKMVQNPNQSAMRSLRLNYYFDLSNISNITQNHVRLGAHTGIYQISTTNSSNI